MNFFRNSEILCTSTKQVNFDFDKKFYLYTINIWSDKLQYLSSKFILWPKSFYRLKKIWINKEIGSSFVKSVCSIVTRGKPSWARRPIHDRLVWVWPCVRPLIPLRRSPCVCTRPLKGRPRGIAIIFRYILLWAWHFSICDTAENSGALC